MGALHSIVSSELDVDRLDYLMRDGQRAGTEFGALDWARLVDSFVLRAEVGDAADETHFRIAPRVRARSAAESLLMQRLQAYRWVIYNHNVIGTNLALALALDQLLELSSDESALELESVSSVVTLRSLLQPCFANLNYLNPDNRALAFTHTAPEANVIVGQDGARYSIGDVFPTLMQDGTVVEQVAASVDDSSVVRSLLDARSIALAAERQLGQPRRHRLAMLVSYIDAAFFRRKTFLAAWDSEDVFAAAAAQLWGGGLRETVTEALDGTAPSYARTILDLPAAQGVNAVFKLLLSQRSMRLRLDAALNDATHTLQGSWHVTRNKLVAASSGSKAGYLFREDGRRFLLAQESALVRSAMQVEAERPDVNGYFFFSNPSFLEQATPGAGPTVELLRGTFLTTFLRFAQNHLIETLTRPELAD